jgi:pimeloyl-ACP methyl ester carboxylesterase
MGSALTMRGVQGQRPSLWDLEDAMATMTVPTLIVTGDEDEPCLVPAIFMKRVIPSSGLVIVPKSGHTINLEEPDAFNRAIADFLALVETGHWDPRDPGTVTESILGER